MRPWRLLLSGLCVLLAVASATVAVVSEFEPFCVVCQAPYEPSFMLGFEGGGLTLGHETAPDEQGRPKISHSKIPYLIQYIRFTKYPRYISLHETPEYDGWALWIGLWPVVILLTLYPAFAAARWVLVRRRLRPGHCAGCGYDLTGNVTGVCSECGTTVASGRA